MGWGGRRRSGELLNMGKQAMRWLVGSGATQLRCSSRVGTRLRAGGEMYAD